MSASVLERCTFAAFYLLIPRCLFCLSAKFQSCRRVCSNRYVFYMTERMLLRAVFHFRLNFEAERKE